MGFWGFVFPGGGARSGARNGTSNYVSPDANRIRVGDDVYHFDGEKNENGFKPLAWKVTGLLSPSEAQRRWPEKLPVWPSLDYYAPYRYPVLLLDDRTVWSAAEAVLKPTIDRIYGA